MTAPDMKSIIESTLAEHQFSHHIFDGVNQRTYLACSCGEKPLVGDHPVHLTRAVMAAISEAGAVEWAIQYGDGDIDQGYLHKSEALTDIERLRERVRLGYDHVDDHEPMTLLTRHRVDHATDWVSVE